MPSTKKLLKVEEVSDQMGLSIPKVRLMIYKRELECVRIGRTVRVPQSELDRLIEENTVPREAVRG